MFIKFSLNYFGFIILLSLFNLGMVLTRNQIIKSINLSISFLHSFVLILFIIPEIILYFVTRKENLIKIDSSRISIIPKKKQFSIIPAKHNKHLAQKIIFLFLLGILATLNPLLEYYFAYWEYFSLYHPFIVFNLIFTWLFSFAFFRTSIYRHHIFALILMIIMRITFCAIYNEIFLTLISVFSIRWDYYITLGLLFVVLISLREVLEKYLMDVCYMSQFLILFIEGCISLCANIVLYFALQTVDYSQLHYLFLKDLCESCTWPILKMVLITVFSETGLIICFICVMVFLSVIHFLRTNINKNKGPSYRYFADSLTESYFYLLIFILRENHFPFKILDIANMVSILLGCLVYNETIIFYFFGLEKNTKIEIQKRQEEDFMISSTTDLFEDD